MIIDINSNRNQNSDGGKDGPSQSSALVLLVRNVVNSCKALSSYEAATAMLLEMYDVVLSDITALKELQRGKEEVRAFFEQRNTPQPSTKIEGCNIYTGDHPQVERSIGKSNDIIAKAQTVNGSLNVGGNLATDSFTDEQIAQTLLACVGKGKVIDNKQKWAGGYWFLRWVCKFPGDVKKCCERIMGLPYPQALEITCDYDNIRRICTCSFMDYDARVMDKVKVSSMDQDAFNSCREIVLKLDETLRNIVSNQG